MEDNRNARRICITGTSYDTVFQLVIPFIDDPLDRSSASLVCKLGYEIEAQTRKHVTIAFCYTTTPKQLSRRFKRIESLKLKGKPRAAMYGLLPDDWGGYATAWVTEVACFKELGSIHFRRMVVTDSDLGLLGKSLGSGLRVLKLDKCSGFSTDGLLYICRSCNNVKTLFLEESTITEKDGKWLHELALKNKVLETLNFYMTDLFKVRFQDLELIAKNCSSLVSMKISDCDILDLVGFFRAAAALEEFGGGSCTEQPDDVGEGAINEQLHRYSTVSFPPLLCRMGLTYMGKNEMPILFPFASRLKKLDLLYALLNTEGHCVLLQRCLNLEILETRTVIGNRGLEVLGRWCKKLKRLRIERAADELEIEDKEGFISQTGLVALAEGCLDLEYLAVHVWDITNAALLYIGNYLKNLRDFRMVLLDQLERVPDLPLDEGVKYLLRKCQKLRRFALYLRPGGLTDVGLRYIGQYSANVNYMLLGHVGESDAGLLELSKGCPNLQKLEMRGCCFSEYALAIATLQLHSLRYLWVQGHNASATGCGLLAMARPFWNIELIPASRIVAADPHGEAVIVEHPAQILAYYSLAGQRTDFPDSGSVIPFDTTSLLASQICL